MPVILLIFFGKTVFVVLDKIQRSCGMRHPLIMNGTFISLGTSLLSCAKMKSIYQDEKAIDSFKKKENQNFSNSWKIQLKMQQKGLRRYVHKSKQKR